MRRLAVAALAAILLVSTACSAKDALSAPTNSGPNVAAPDMVAMKAKSEVEPCPAGQTHDGGLPDGTLPCLGGGRRVDLSRLKGPLVINFFQGECAPCKKEMPALEAFYKKYGDRVPVLGIDTMDYIPGVALRQAIQRGVTFPLAADPNGELQGSALSVSAVPTTYALTADGKVVRLKRGGMESLAEVERLVRSNLGTAL